MLLLLDVNKAIKNIIKERQDVIDFWIKVYVYTESPSMYAKLERNYEFIKLLEKFIEQEEADLPP